MKGERHYVSGMHRTIRLYGYAADRRAAVGTTFVLSIGGLRMVSSQFEALVRGVGRQIEDVFERNLCPGGAQLRQS